jgi:release factor glutamine methyltransferase
MTTEQYYNDFLNQLNSIYEKREAANITDWVFENITGFKRIERIVNRNAELGKSVLQKLKSCLHELLQHKPVQYVLNEAWFYKMRFYVNENVLIPRPETEELAEWIVRDVRSTMYDVRCEEFKILDIGTGSGCIAVSIKKELENIDVTAIDVTEEAVSVAKKNADALNAKINFLQLDFLSENVWNSLGVYDIIVSNPPYIPESEKKKLDKNVAAFEPGVALFVENNNAFIFYEKIAKFAQSHLSSNGKIFVEIHEEYSNEIKKIFAAYNFKTKMKRDMYGKERMVKAVSF